MVDLLRKLGSLPAFVLVASGLLAPACAPHGGGGPGGGVGEASAPVAADSAAADSAAANSAASPARIASDRLVDRARVERRDGDPDAAVTLLERAVRVDPSNGRAYLELALVRSGQGLRDAALGLAERARELLRPGSPARARADSLRAALGGA
jgi:tetratricopeptide (TPR) repeat protein